MKTIYFIRHAKSSWADPFLSDMDRPLNKRGLRDAPFMAKLLQSKEIKVDKIISSPANRALTTANYFAEALQFPESSIWVNPTIYEAFTGDIISLIENLDNSWNTVFFFGHNPTFTSVANIFAQEYIPNVPTCGIVKVISECVGWHEFFNKKPTLKNFYYPKQYFK